MVFNLTPSIGRALLRAGDKGKNHAGQNNNETKARAARVAKVSKRDALETKVKLTGKFSASALSLPAFFGRHWLPSERAKFDAPILAPHSDASHLALTSSSISLTLTESDPGKQLGIFTYSSARPKR